MTEWGRPNRTDEVHRGDTEVTPSTDIQVCFQGREYRLQYRGPKIPGTMGSREFSGQIDFGKIVGTLWVGSQRGLILDALEAGCR